MNFEHAKAFTETEHKHNFAKQEYCELWFFYFSGWFVRIRSAERHSVMMRCRGYNDRKVWAHTLPKMLLAMYKDLLGPV